MGLIFQRVSAAELPAIIALSQKIWIPTFAPFFRQDELKTLYHGMYDPTILTNWLSHPLNAMYIISQNGRDIGYFATAEEGKTLKLDKIYVLPELQRTGIGGKVMDYVATKTQEGGCSQITLRVNRENQSAINFYTNRGFVITDSIDLPAENGFFYEDYIMAKTL